ncbi:polyisoprenyl-teichoic acid--peptidoglycan teichoic acid transferase [Marmoricola sp. URHA0025 HA25]
MPRASGSVPLHTGRHKAVRPDQVGRALRRALVATLAPALLLSVASWIVVRTSSSRMLDLALDPAALAWVIAGIVIVWVLWVALIWRTYARHRVHTATRPLRILGAVGVALMCGAVTAPMAVGAKYAVVQRDLIGSVFGDQASATTPKVTAANPWGKRDRVNVLLLGGDGAVHRPGVRTDSVILASISTKTGRTVLFSLPRNLERVPFQPGSKLAEIYPDGFTDGSSEPNANYFLNAVYRDVPALHPGVLGKTANEGADAVKLAVAGALGIRVDYYVLVNLAGFQRLVDAMGGITVNINEPVPIGGNTDAHIAPDDYLQPGPSQRLNGFQALWFTRGRYGSTDYKRMERQRCAINAIVEEASPVKMLKRYTKLAATSKDIVRTDIPAKLLPAFVDLAGKVKDVPIKSVGFELSDAFNPNDPDFDYVHAAVQQALRPARAAGSATGTAGAATPSSPTSSGSPTSTSTADAEPSRASDANDDCAYRPVGGTTAQ